MKIRKKIYLEKNLLKIIKIINDKLNINRIKTKLIEKYEYKLKKG